VSVVAVAITGSTPTRSIVREIRQRTALMPLNKLLDDPELNALVAKVEAAYGADEIPRAIERAYGAIVREQRAQIKTGALPDADSLPVMRGAFRRELEALLRAH